jgi:ABC-type branched-subunit amino acid transport system substrate-binding protein
MPFEAPLAFVFVILAPMINAAAKKKVLRAVSFLSLLFAALAPTAAASENYRIGVPLPLSGPRQPRGEMMLHSLQIKADEINAAGGVNGHKIELVVRDNAGSAELSRKVATEMAADKSVLAVIGHYDSEPASAAVPIYTENHLPVFLPSIGDNAALAHSPWAFGGTYDDASEAQTMAAFIKAIRHHASVLVLYGADKYGRDLWDAFKEKAARVGLKARGVEYPASDVPADYVAKHLAGATAGVEAVVVFGHSANGGPLIRQLRERGVHQPIYGSSRVASGELLKELGPETADVHAAFPFMFDMGSLRALEFREAYEKRFGSEPNSFGLFAYDGLGMLAEAIRTKGADRTAIRDYLAGLNSATSAYDGASGVLFFNKNGAMVRDTVMGVIMNGAFHACYQQLRLVTEQHTLNNLAEKIKAGEVISVDGVPFFLINVVYVGVEWYRVDQVNIKDLNFDAEFFLWLKWSGDVDIENVQFLNELPGKGYRIEMRRATVPADWHGGQDVKWISYRYKGTFLHSYDLHQFPFDRQELPLLLAHKSRNANKIQLVVDSGNIVDRPINEIYPQEWRYMGRKDYAATFRYASSFGNPTYRPGEAQAPYSVYRSTLQVHRILFPYLVTLFLPLAILIFVSLLVLLIPKEQFSTRNSLVMSSLLGVLVYHMAQARALPQVGYLMKADLYFVVSYFLLAVLVLGINVVNLLFSRKEVEKAARVDGWLDEFFIVASILAYSALTISGFMASR